MFAPVAWTFICIRQTGRSGPVSASVEGLRYLTVLAAAARTSRGVATFRLNRAHPYLRFGFRIVRVTRALRRCCAARGSCGAVGRQSFPERLSGRMTDPFVDVETVEGFDSMSRATEPTSGRSASAVPHAANGAPANGLPTHGGSAAPGNPAGGHYSGHPMHAEPASPPSISPSVSQQQPVAAPQTVREYLVGKHVCPFCGTPNPVGVQPCPRCTMDDTPASRQATKSRIGPWYVLQ